MLENNWTWPWDYCCTLNCHLRGYHTLFTTEFWWSSSSSFANNIYWFSCHKKFWIKKTFFLSGFPSNKSLDTAICVTNVIISFCGKLLIIIRNMGILLKKTEWQPRTKIYYFEDSSIGKNILLVINCWD